MNDFTYVLPIRSRVPRREREFTEYLRRLAQKCDLVVVDGSEPDVFASHHEAWDFCRHVQVDPELTYANGKVNGVLTGIQQALHERIVIADEDVRYGAEALQRVVHLLDHVELVRPQNYFDPMPWHATWDSARTLVNRAFWRDFPGTLAVRRSTILDAGGYNGNVLFENLQLIRTVQAAGGRTASPLDLYVLRRPPTTRQFLSQRVRQAYDDFASPTKMAALLGVIPALAIVLCRRSYTALALFAGGSVAVAEIGRRRAGGVRYFPWQASLFAPVWLLERAICAWVAVAVRAIKGGYPYYGVVVRDAVAPCADPPHPPPIPERPAAFN